ncbi:MAG: hypothetical protein K2X29_11695 [Candidatus Obscuribacterales bacterium]|nr:hypothetical protein [Candidatus Obscuribacterales bacterium]
MKIKALFAAILGCINVIVPLASQAAEEAVSDKADWLKKSLASVGETQAIPASTLTVADIPAPAKRKRQLRAFMANRPLPRKTDLATVARLGVEDDSLANQIPVGLASSNKMVVVEDLSPLAGQVSLNSTANSSNENLALKAITTTFTHFNSARAKTAKKPSSNHLVPEPPKTALNQNVSALISSLPNHVLNDVDITDNKTDNISLKERQLIEKLSAEMKTGDIDVSDDNVETVSADSLSELQAQDQQAATSAGPAPFPLNLIPQQSLKGLFSGGRRAPIATKPVSFGSWHSLVQGQGSARSVARAALPSAGFVSHIRRSAVSRATGFATRYTHVNVSGTSARSLAGTVKQIAARQVDSLARYAPYTAARVYLF